MYKLLCEYNICNFSELLIYDMNRIKGLGKVFKKKKLLSHYFIKIINLAR